MANEKRNRQQPQETQLELQEVETTLPAPEQDLSSDMMERAIGELINLPFPAQLSVLRLVVPSVLEALGPEDRDRLISDLRPDVSPLH